MCRVCPTHPPILNTPTCPHSTHTHTDDDKDSLGYPKCCCLLQCLQLSHSSLQAALVSLRLVQSLVSAPQDVLLIRQQPLFGLCMQRHSYYNTISIIFIVVVFVLLLITVVIDGCWLGAVPAVCLHCKQAMLGLSKSLHTYTKNCLLAYTCRIPLHACRSECRWACQHHSLASHNQMYETKFNQSLPDQPCTSFVLLFLYACNILWTVNTGYQHRLSALQQHAYGMRGPQLSTMLPWAPACLHICIDSCAISSFPIVTHLDCALQGFILSLQGVEARHLALQRLDLGCDCSGNCPLSLKLVLILTHCLLTTPLHTSQPGCG